MTAFLSDVRDTLGWDRQGKHGPLPPMLVAMTLVTGLVDAFSYLVLGHVFVANMTGNVVLLGFALVGAPGFSISSSLVAIAAFSLGSFTGGRIGTRFGDHRGRHLRSASAAQVVFLGTGTLLAELSTRPLATGLRFGLIAVLAVGMGIQNATARKLAVPDLTTTVLTMTLTGMTADSVLGGGSGSKAGRRFIAVGTMLAGAVIGAAFIVHHEIVYPVLIASVVTVSVALGAAALARSDEPWTRPAH